MTGVGGSGGAAAMAVLSAGKTEAERSRLSSVVSSSSPPAMELDGSDGSERAPSGAVSAGERCGRACTASARRPDGEYEAGDMGAMTRSGGEAAKAVELRLTTDRRSHEPPRTDEAPGGVFGGCATPPTHRHGDGVRPNPTPPPAGLYIYACRPRTCGKAWLAANTLN